MSEDGNTVEPDWLDSPAGLELDPNTPMALELGSSALLAVQLPPSGTRETSLVLKSAREDQRAAAETALEVEVEVTREASRDPEGPWPWLEPLVDPATLSPIRQAELGAWLLDGAEMCDPVEISPICADRVVAWPRPPYRDLDDPCWKLGRAIEVADASASTALEANLDAWLGLIEASDFRPRGAYYSGYEVEWTPREELFAILTLSLPPRTILPALVLDIDADFQTPLDAIAELHGLPAAEAEAIARTLLESLRSDYSRCEEVVALAELLDEIGAAPPRWQAELDDECDILFVMCTELQDDLADLVVDPAGFTVTETCASDRPSDSETAEAWGVEVCTPSSGRFKTFEFGEYSGISPVVAASCGTDEVLTEQVYSCGVHGEFAVHTFRSTIDTNQALLRPRQRSNGRCDRRSREPRAAWRGPPRPRRWRRRVATPGSARTARQDERRAEAAERDDGRRAWPVRSRRPGRSRDSSSGAPYPIEDRTRAHDSSSGRSPASRSSHRGTRGSTCSRSIGDWVAPKISLSLDKALASGAIEEVSDDCHRLQWTEIWYVIISIEVAARDSCIGLEHHALKNRTR
ncbi:hypothetical protein G6O69_12040 [Pseudenhygromyxa sp. WMMC2535]|uniref:hypothetical protein n=1 Tax=Pseudenhygromyxa sp. WMMC2535 TaxID=2712867 RepID=UPI00155388C2|nr:hypothetical protein [Pseudenhygromyxa sp. WMMC2535]NVB38563.1 hypothetical protein [Pseudenhygromyxa sp. WMMC2535]